jgi:membrane protein implicated in regulation of membrane protease activity
MPIKEIFLLILVIVFSIHPFLMLASLFLLFFSGIALTTDRRCETFITPAGWVVLLCAGTMLCWLVWTGLKSSSEKESDASNQP